MANRRSRLLRASSRASCGTRAARLDPEHRRYVASRSETRLQRLTDAAKKNIPEPAATDLSFFRTVQLLEVPPIFASRGMQRSTKHVPMYFSPHHAEKVQKRCAPSSVQTPSTITSITIGAQRLLGGADSAGFGPSSKRAADRCEPVASSRGAQGRGQCNRLCTVLTANGTEWASFGAIFGDGSDESGVDVGVVLGQEHHRRGDAVVSCQACLRSTGWKSAWTEAQQGKGRGTRGGTFVAAGTA